MYNSRREFTKDYGVATIDLLKIIVCVALAVLVYVGFQKITDSVTGWFGTSKVELVEENKRLKQRISTLETESRVSGVVKETDNKLDKVDDKVDKEQEQTEIKTGTTFKKVKDKSKVKITQIDQTPDLTKEERFVQKSQVIYDAVSEALCLADPTQCEGNAS